MLSVLIQGESTMFGLGTQELLIILVLVMIVFGAGKLPQVGGALGKGLRNFKKGVTFCVIEKFLTYCHPVFLGSITSLISQTDKATGF